MVLPQRVRDSVPPPSNAPPRMIPRATTRSDPGIKPTPYPVDPARTSIDPKDEG